MTRDSSLEPAYVAAAGRDLCRSRRDLLIENSVLRHELGILRRRSQRRKLNLMDRLRLLLGARLLEHWRAAIVVVQPDPDSLAPGWLPPLLAAPVSPSKNVAAAAEDH